MIKEKDNVQTFFQTNQATRPRHQFYLTFQYDHYLQEHTHRGPPRCRETINPTILTSDG